VTGYPIRRCQLPETEQAGESDPIEPHRAALAQRVQTRSPLQVRPPRIATKAPRDREYLRERITEATEHGWLDEVEDLEVTLAGPEEKLRQM
jgi:hypothetical protein